MRRRAEIHETGDLPKNILGLCSTCQRIFVPLLMVRFWATGRSDVARRTREVISVRDQEPSAPFVDARG